MSSLVDKVMLSNIVPKNHKTSGCLFPNVFWSFGQVFFLTIMSCGYKKTLTPSKLIGNYYLEVEDARRMVDLLQAIVSTPFSTCYFCFPMNEC